MPTQTEAPDLDGLLRRVFEARRTLERARKTVSGHRTDTTFARHELIDALETYTTGLESMNKPVPYRLRDELRLNRRLDSWS